MNISEVLQVSRPRFWLYEAATFGLVGTVSAMQGLGFFTDYRYWIFAFYFLIPANILIYGINDIFDYDTDKLNPKKGTYEALVVPERQKSLWFWIVLTNIPFLFFVPFEPALLVSFAAFVFFATFYSAKPIRAKAKPFIDSLFSAGHYVATGVFGFYLAHLIANDSTSLANITFPLLGTIAAMLWAVAMHAYSAVPDIAADTEAKLKTIAIMFGKSRTIYLCWIFYVLAGVLVFPAIPYASVLGILTFSFFMYASIRTKSEEALFKIYTYFPLINTIIGATISIELFAKNIL